MIVSFTDYIPAPRYDHTPWIAVSIEESTSGTGPWTIIDSIVLTPVDPDPANPMPRSFTTENATLQFGWYRVSFVDNVGERGYTDPIYNAQPYPWQPTVKEVATHILARTVNQYGVRLGTFTIDTTPTQAEAEQVIAITMPEIADAVGETIPEFLWDDTQVVASIKAAMQIEIAFFPEQIASNRSPYNALNVKYTAALDNLVHQVSVAGTGSEGTVVAGASNTAQFAFPPAFPLMSYPWPPYPYWIFPVRPL